MAAYRYFHEGQLKVDPTTGTRCRTGQLNHQFVEQKYVGGAWVGIGDNDGVRYGDVAGVGRRFREGMRDGDYVVDVETEIAGFLLAEGDGWVNCGSVSGGFTQLPQKLIVTPDIYTEEFDSTAGWTAGGGGAIVAINNTEIHSGTSSIKMTTASGDLVQISKSVVWDLSADSGYSLKLWIYPHSVPVDTINSISLWLAKDAGWTDYFVIYIDPTLPPLIQNQWCLLTLTIPSWSVGAGNPNFNNIGIFRIRMSAKAGQIAEASFDFVTEGRVLKKSALIMFDDGGITNYTKAYPLLKAKDMVATAYVVADWVGTGLNMNVAQLQELNANKWDIANHSKDHTVFTTLSQLQIEASINGCKTFLDGIGLTRAGLHVAYPGGLFDADTLAAMAAVGAKTGRKLSNRVTYIQDIGWPYEVECLSMSPTTSSADIIGFIDSATRANMLPIFLFHKLVDAAPGANECLVSVFSDGINYLASEGFQTLTIDEYYRLYSGPITVHHK